MKIDKKWVRVIDGGGRPIVCGWEGVIYSRFVSYKQIIGDSFKQTHIVFNIQATINGRVRSPQAAITKNNVNTKAWRIYEFLLSILFHSFIAYVIILHSYTNYFRLKVTEPCYRYIQVN